MNIRGELVIVAINTSYSEVAASFSVEDAPLLVSLRAIRTSDTEDWLELPAPTIALNAFDFSLPERSFTTFVPEPRGFAQQAAAILAVALLCRLRRHGVSPGSFAFR